MSNFVIFKGTERNDAYMVNLNQVYYMDFQLSGDRLDIFLDKKRKEFFSCWVKKHAKRDNEKIALFKNIRKAIDDGFVDFTDDKLYDFSFENMRAMDAGGVNNKFIDSDLKAEYKKEFDFYYQKMLNLIIANNDLKFAEFMYAMSDFFASVLSDSEFNETPFELREKFYEYLTDKFNL